MTLIIAHQYGERLASSIVERLPEGVTFTALGATADTAWQVPMEAEVLLINQESAVVGLHKDMSQPPGWPFHLRWVHLRSTGLDKYPDWLFTAPRVTVTRGGYSVPISEFVLAAMLAFAKDIPRVWARSRTDWHQHRLAGLEGRTLGIVGFGAIGKAIARRALAFDMTVIGMRRSPGPSGVAGVDIVPLDDLLRRSDHVVVCTPLTDETRGMIDARAFAAMKAGAHLLNVGRGPVIDSEALRLALDCSLGGATLDVTDPEPPPDGHWLYHHPKVRVSPHISGSSPETKGRITAFFLENLERYRRGEELLGLVDRTLRY
ncbi:NAD(P)-dependent oxidoreductase [Devosia nitrariae]|uniref:Dihydrofolate reductase n=1 Tax=Devosia nitrariae TaxID=2071872 RepID=A0ABQ5W6D8_9HYPH|nr:NAD(P)-dependent oxidoreductase [Devosia nitrariae]GLQ55629.1 dihydrofolate reductase [Devosia nitrariae]